MKKELGILGLGTRSTLFYLEQLQKRYHELKGHYYTFPFKMLNVDFQQYNPFLPHDYAVLLPQLKNDLKLLANWKVDAILIPNITLHQTVDRLADDFKPKKKIIHPHYLAVQKLRDSSLEQAVIFGTIYTMQSTELRKFYESQGIDLLKPNRKDALYLDQLRSSVFDGSDKDIDRKKFQELLEKYVSSKRAVLIACTELSLLFDQNLSTRIFDLPTLQVQKILDL